MCSTDPVWNSAGEASTRLLHKPRQLQVMVRLAFREEQDPMKGKSVDNPEQQEI